jgi:arylsulfatase A-like enzyme
MQGSGPSGQKCRRMVRDRPNILFITSDQQRGDCFGFEGRGVRTPHLDRLAASGTRFSACITPAPVCAPARASILTGELPFTHGVYDNGVDLDPAAADRGFAARLARAGYATALIGKAHFSSKNTFQPTGRPECLASSRDFGPGWTGPYMGFDHVELMLFGHLQDGALMPVPPDGLHYEDWYHRRLADGGAHALWRQATRERSGAHQTWSSALPVAWHTSTWVADRTIARLRAMAEADRPFCLWASFPDPHQPFDCPEPWASVHPPNTIRLPEDRHRDLDRRPWYHRAFLEGAPKVDDPTLREVRTSGSRSTEQTDEQLADMISNYFGMVALVDHGVGRILDALADLDLAEDTVVVFTSDHGDYLGDHGLTLKGPAPYEGLLRVGLIVAGPGVDRGHVVREPISTIDLCETFCDYGGCARGPSRDAQGASLLAALEGRFFSREAAYSEWHVMPSRFGYELDLRTVRTRDAKLTVETLSRAGEMYDLAKDPGEMTNLYDDPSAASMRRRLEDLLARRPGPMLETLPPVVGIG